MSIATTTVPLFKSAQDEIAHWTSVCNAHSRTPTLKRAVGEGQDVPFEQAFSNLAHAYLKDKAPQLLDYELGFQLLEKNEDNDKAVGVFGFKVGPQWLYAPVFFLNGELKGHELLYLKDSDTFIPLQENWINYILNRKPDVLGEEVNQNTRLLGVERPDVQQFRQTPNKFASAQEPWLQHGLPGLAWAADFRRLAKPDSAVRRLVKESAAAATLLCKWVDARPKLGRTLLDAYGPELLTDAVRTAKTASTVNPIEVTAAPRRFTTGSIFPTAAEIRKQAMDARHNKLRIIRYNGQYRTDLTDSEREQLMKVGHLICDWRDDAETSRLYHVPTIKTAADKPGEGKDDPSVTATQRPLTLMNPDETNIYEVLVHPDGFEDCVLIHGPMGGRGTSESCVLISKSDPRSWCVEHPGNIFTISKFSRADYDAWFKGLPEATSLDKGSHYVLLGPRGNGTLPFEVEKSSPTSKDDEKCYEVYWEGDYGRRPDHLPPLGKRKSVREAYGYNHKDRVISIGGSKGTNATSRGGVVYIPAGWKALKLKSPPEDASMCCDSDAPGEGPGSDPKPLRPGTHLDLQLGIITKTAELKVWCDGVETIIDGRRMPKRDAMFSLVRDYGLREKAASEALQQAERAHAKRAPGVKFRIKFAQPYELIQSAPSAPGVYPDQSEQTTDPWMGSGLPTTLSQEWEIPIEGMRTASRNELPNNGPPSPDPDAMNRVQQAAQTGQKEILDTSMLSGLLKGTRREALIDKYLPDLVKGLDRIGRILFNFYWHHDLFEEEYGQQDLHELEDSLKNSYESNGDLVLWLKQKTVEPYPGEATPDLQMQAEA